ncbi:MAG TPA: hypothetical protein VMY40_10965 [Anaerolineae bacterium]|nr:hypothetical protein [Anaerolineae bacterium]
MADSERLKTLSGPVQDGVKELMRQIDRGLKRQEEELPAWSKNECFDKAQHWSVRGAAAGDRKYGYGTGDETTTNLVGAYIQNHRAAVAFNNPRAKFRPKNQDGYNEIPVPVLGEDGKPAVDEAGQIIVRPVVKHKVREAIINNMLEHPEFGLQATSGRVVKASDLAFGAVKIGYLPEFEKNPEPDGAQPIPIGEDGKLDFSQYATSPADGLPMESEDGRLIDRSSIPLWEDWFVKSVNYRDIILDPDGTNDFSTHRWVCEMEVRTLEAVKADKMLENTDDLKGDWIGDYEDDEYRKRWEDSAFATEDGTDEERWRKVRLFHFWDLVNKKWIVLADGHGKYLRDGPLPRGVDGHPYMFLCPNEVLGEPYPRPKVSDLAPLNEEYDILCQMELRAAKRNTRKWGLKKGALDPKNLVKFNSDEDLQVVEFDSKPGVDPQGNVWPLMAPSQSYDVAKAIQRAERNFNQVSGLSTAARGEASGGTATETNAQEAHSGSRVKFELAQMREFWRGVLRKLDNSLEANMTVTRAVQVEGSDGQVFAGVADWDMIKGDFDADVDVRDIAPPDDRAEGAQIIQLASLFGQFPFLAADEALVRMWCEKFDIMDERGIKALVNAAQMQLQMLAMQAMPPQPSPEAGPPTNEADAVSQSAAGAQVPRMRGAT